MRPSEGSPGILTAGRRGVLRRLHLTRSAPASVLQALVEERRDAIKDAARRHRGVSIPLFGSAARGTDEQSSDGDFLVEFESGSSLFDLLHLQDELQQLLGRPVDVVSVAGLKPRDDRIRRERSPCESRSDDERVADMLDAADQLAQLVERGRAEFTRLPSDGLVMRP